jgi:hypothetical protein
VEEQLAALKEQLQERDRAAATATATVHAIQEQATAQQAAAADLQAQLEADNKMLQVGIRRRDSCLVRKELAQKLMHTPLVV